MSVRPIKEIKEELLTINNPNDERLAACRLDSRKGVQQAIAKWERDYEKELARIAQKEAMLSEERILWNEGYQLIAGIDEVGRGPLAGPVVAAAVILPDDFDVLGINDSKQMSASVRNELYDQIMNRASVGIGIISAPEIDEINIYQATKRAMLQAVEGLSLQPDALLIDAMKLDVPTKQVSLIKGDARSYSIAAASIVAKVTRDRMIEEYAAHYPGYAFERNAGYGTKDHLKGLEVNGITPIHRKSFEPIKSMIAQ